MGKVAPSVIAREQLQRLLAGSVDRERNIVSALVEAVTRLVVQELVEGEQGDFLGGRGHYERRGDGRVGSRNGYQPGRIRTAEGSFDVAVPQVRGTVTPFRSSLMSFLDGNSDVLDRLVTEMYVRGLSTRDVEDAFRDATGELLISKSAVSEITDRLWEDYQAFTSRDLSDRGGVPVRRRGVRGAAPPRREGGRVGRLVHRHRWAQAPAAPGCGEQGERSLLDRVLPRHARRGLRLPTTATSDGAPGLIRAIEVCFPTTVRIRCWFHRLANIHAAKLPMRPPARSWRTCTPCATPPPWTRPEPQRTGSPTPTPATTRRGGLLHRRPRRSVEHPPRPGPTPHPGPHHEPVRTLLRRGTPTHQSHPPLHRREGRDEARVRDPRPGSRSLVPGLDQRPRATPAQAPTRRARARPTTHQQARPDPPTQNGSSMNSRPSIYRTLGT